MRSQDEQGLQVKHDLQYLTRTLTSDNIDIGLMFAPDRSIRSCTPSFAATAGAGPHVSERLKRIRVPHTP
ncbi:hypothetical protein [Methanoregula sp.]|uniref:hypothetical protein n=1 Tax=Methanoregula sp. TaxID=2052170 RepID=UPI0035655819